MSKRIFLKIGISLIIALTLNVKLLAVDQITFTWQLDLSYSSLNKRVKIQATEGETFTVNWGDNSQIVTETGVGSSNVTLSHTYALADEYTVTITASNPMSRFISFDCSGYTFDWDVVNNQISSLKLTDCSVLQTLNCRLNLLTDLDLSTCVALQNLNCSYNLLNSLDLNNRSTLTHLDCGANKIQNLNLIGSPNLINLRCNDNLLKSLDLSVCPNLQVLFAGGNLLTNLNLTSSAVLTDLYCGGNQLTNLDLINCFALQVLVCNYNQLTELDFTNCPNLYRLDCTNNKITALDLTGCPNIESLACAYNQLTELDLTNYAKLSLVHCYNNLLTKWNIANCPALSVIWCMDNLLTSINVTNCPVLLNLFCNDNQLTSIYLSNCPKLNMLYCYNNLLTNLNLSGQSNLQSIECHNNQLMSLNLTGCSALSGLRCHNNQLQLSDLYAAHLLISQSYFKRFGTQRLVSQTITVGNSIDYSAQKQFGSTITSFTIEKDGMPATISDISMSDGVITFNNIGNYTVTMTNSAIISNGSYPVEVIADIIVTDNTAISEISVSNIKIYPNPTSDILFVECENINAIKLYDLLGKEVLTQISNGKVTVNISHLPKGIYNVQIISNGKITGNSKIVKQ